MKKKIVNEFIKNQEEEFKRLKEEYLIEKGIVEKDISKSRDENHLYYDEEKKVYYGYVPVKISDKEFEEILENENKLKRLRNKNFFVGVYKIGSILIAFVGIIVATIMAKTYGIDEFLKAVYNFGCMSLIFLGIAKILEGQNN